MNTSTIVQKLWNYCNVLRDDGMSYGDYVEQLTYLLLLKMADERTKAPYNQKSPVPEKYNWPSLIKKDGDDMFDHYRHTLEALGNQKGLLGLSFNKSQNKFQDPAKLRRLVVDLIDKEEWVSMSADVKGDAYEGLLEKNAQDTKSGAGQCFTPRPLIDSDRPWSSASGRTARAQFRSQRNCQAIVDVMAPKPGETVSDPACGTGGFLLAAHEYVVKHNPNLTKPQKTKLKEETFKGSALVRARAQRCVMNMLLHGIGSQDFEPIAVSDSLAAAPGDRFDLVLTNPPFGKKGSTTIVGEEGKVSKERDIVERGFWTTTSNKQLNFVQHVKTLLKQNGRAAVVVPDNVLFEGGAGETIRRDLLQECDVHTLLRPTSIRIPCAARRPRAQHPWRARSPGRRSTGPSTCPAHPTGLFYAQGVKANVLFFDKKPASETPWTKKLWIYALRTNMHFTLKTSPLQREDLDEFVKCYNPDNRYDRKAAWSPQNPDGRWRSYDYADLTGRDKASLYIFWLKDESLSDSDNLPAPEVIAQEIVDDMEAVLEQFRLIAGDMGLEDGSSKTVGA